MDNLADSLQALIEARLQDLHPSQLRVIDESHQHVGHAGAKAGGKHFAVEIVCAQFSGLSLIQRHQLVYGALKDLLGPQQIHALRIKANTPDEKT